MRKGDLYPNINPFVFDGAQDFCSEHLVALACVLRDTVVMVAKYSVCNASVTALGGKHGPMSAAATSCGSILTLGLGMASHWAEACVWDLILMANSVSESLLWVRTHLVRT
jgi:hypothetical protein